MRRKYSPLHDFWHRRVEGQIRCCMTEHPEWFSLKTSSDKSACINSLAKRIVGEIIAVATKGNNPSLSVLRTPKEVEGVGDPSLLTPGEDRVAHMRSSLIAWVSTKTSPKSSSRPYLITYKPAKSRPIVAIAIWAGQARGWIFRQNLKNAQQKRVTHWALFPRPAKKENHDPLLRPA